MEKEVNNITAWLKQTVSNAGLDGLLVGISGGLDSAVVANLIQRAFPENSLGVIMPIHTSTDNMTDADKVVEDCGIDSMTIDLTETHDMMYNGIRNQLKAKVEFNEENDRLAGANLRARLRMSTLYTLATNYNYLVVGTDNASEFYTGYFTKYGDGGVDILPIVEFTKTEVRKMAAYLNVPESVVSKKPSADLWEDQTDEAEMGVSYDTIDAYLKGADIPEKEKQIIEAMHRKTAHKRDDLPAFRRS